MATEYKKLNELNIKASVDLTNDYATITNGTSSYRMQMQKIIDQATEAAKLAVTSGLLVYVVTKTSPYSKRLVTPSYWLHHSAEYIPLGIAFQGPTRILIAGLTEISLPVTTAGVRVTDKTWNAETVFSDWDGKGNTTEMLTHSECSGTNTAAGWCNSHSVVVPGTNSGVGSWYLGSFAEMMSLHLMRDKVDSLLSIIDGAQLLSNAAYCTSSEHGVTTQWVINFSDGNFLGAIKTVPYRVRPFTIYR